MIKLEDKMPFGKHKGEEAWLVAAFHHNYILWAAKNTNFKFSDKVMHIAKTEKRQAEGRKLAYAYMMPCKRRMNNWHLLKEDTPLSKHSCERSGPDEEDDNDEPDEYAGMSYSDFGNN